MHVSNDQFDRYVRQAIDAFDPRFRPYLDEVPVIVENLPSPQLLQTINLPKGHTLLGLFQGQPLNRRSATTHQLPSNITLYRQNILARCHNHKQLAEQIRRTIIHELVPVAEGRKFSRGILTKFRCAPATTSQPIFAIPLRHFRL